MRTIQLKGGGEIVCTAIKVTYGAQNQAQITTLSGYLIKKNVLQSRITSSHR